MMDRLDSSMYRGIDQGAGPDLQRQAIMEVLRERDRQEELWAGTPGHIADPETTDEHRLTVFLEEVGETAKEVLEGGRENGKLRTELVQAVAVGLAWLETLGTTHAPGTGAGRSVDFNSISPSTAIAHTSLIAGS
jgi:hypothetical protein